MDSEGLNLNSWTAFTLIDYGDLPNITKNASRHTVPFQICVLKLKYLATLKFWIEDLIRMNGTHAAAAAFTRPTMLAYIQLYAAYTKAKDDNVEFVNGP